MGVFQKSYCGQSYVSFWGDVAVGRGNLGGALEALSKGLVDGFTTARLAAVFHPTWFRVKARRERFLRHCCLSRAEPILGVLRLMDEGSGEALAGERKPT